MHCLTLLACGVRKIDASLPVIYMNGLMDVVLNRMLEKVGGRHRILTVKSVWCHSHILKLVFCLDETSFNI